MDSGVQLNSVDTGLHLTVITAYGLISGRVKIPGNKMTIGKIATGVVGHIGDVGDQQLWILRFLKRSVEMTFSQDTLIWKSGTDRLSFKNN